MLVEAFTDAERVHLIGLVSDGGVHSGWEHLRALIEMGAELGAPEVVVHAFTDGRDTSPTGGAGYLETVEGWCRDGGQRPRRLGRRALLRDGPRQALGPHPARLRPDRPRRGAAPRRPGVDAVQAGLRPRRDRRVHPPTLVGDEARIRDQDSVICFNFRPDRMRQIVRALADPAFNGVDRRGRGAGAQRLATMASYEEDWSYPVAFPQERPKATLAQRARRPRPPPAPRGRDREVRPRDLLLQRRRGGPARAARTASSCPRRATSPPTTTSRR